MEGNQTAQSPRHRRLLFAVLVMLIAGATLWIAMIASRPGGFEARGKRWRTSAVTGISAAVTGSKSVARGNRNAEHKRTFRRLFSRLPTLCRRPSNDKR